MSSTYRRVVSIFCAFVVISSSAAAQTIGIDTLAGAKYPAVVRTIPNKFPIGVFAETFGDAFPLVRQELRAGRALVRVHFLWSDSHSFSDRDMPRIKALAEKYAPLCREYGLRLELSPLCEHNLAAPHKFLDAVAELAPGCRVVNTPWKGALSGKYKNEVHGDHKPPAGPYNHSFDGTNAVDSNVMKVRRIHSRADVLFIWNPRLNLKWSMKDTTPRPQRKALPTPEFMRSLEYLEGSPGEAKLPVRWLAKSHSERHSATDTKGDKLLIISPVKAAAVQLKRAGKVITTLPYYGPYDAGGHRYYSKSMGFTSGGALQVFVNGKRYGTIDGGFRCCTYR